MSFRQWILGAGALAAFTAPATSAFAHAHLETSTPAANAIVTTPASIVLHFTEALESRFSGAEIAGARDGVVKAVSAADRTDPATLVVTPAAPLAAGVYNVAWHIVAKDGHRMRGTFSFTVKP